MIKIENMKKRDFSDVFEISKAELLSESWTNEMFLDSFKNKNYSCIVAKSDEKIVGFLTFQSSVYDIDILLIAVKKDFQRKGIGRLLVEYLKNSSKGKFETINLEVKENNNSAILFYENLGFVKISERKKYYSDGKTAFIYQLKL